MKKLSQKIIASILIVNVISSSVLPTLALAQMYDPYEYGYGEGEPEPTPIPYEEPAYSGGAPSVNDVSGNTWDDWTSTADPATYDYPEYYPEPEYSTNPVFQTPPPEPYTYQPPAASDYETPESPGAYNDYQYPSTTPTPYTYESPEDPDAYRNFQFPIYTPPPYIYEPPESPGAYAQFQYPQPTPIVYEQPESPGAYEQYQYPQQTPEPNYYEPPIDPGSYAAYQYPTPIPIQNEWVYGGYEPDPVTPTNPVVPYEWEPITFPDPASQPAAVNNYVTWTPPPDPYDFSSPDPGIPYTVAQAPEAAGGFLSGAWRTVTAFPGNVASTVGGAVGGLFGGGAPVVPDSTDADQKLKTGIANLQTQLTNREGNLLNVDQGQCNQMGLTPKVDENGIYLGCSSGFTPEPAGGSRPLTSNNDKEGRNTPSLPVSPLGGQPSFGLAQPIADLSSPDQQKRLEAAGKIVNETLGGVPELADKGKKINDKLDQLNGLWAEVGVPVLLGVYNDPNLKNKALEMPEDEFKEYARRTLAFQRQQLGLESTVDDEELIQKALKERQKFKLESSLGTDIKEYEAEVQTAVAITAAGVYAGPLAEEGLGFAAGLGAKALKKAGKSLTREAAAEITAAEREGARLALEAKDPVWAGSEEVLVDCAVPVAGVLGISATISEALKPKKEVLAATITPKCRVRSASLGKADINPKKYGQAKNDDAVIRQNDDGSVAIADGVSLNHNNAPGYTASQPAVEFSSNVLEGIPINSDPEEVLLKLNKLRDEGVPFAINTAGGRGSTTFSVSKYVENGSDRNVVTSAVGDIDHAMVTTDGKVELVSSGYGKKGGRDFSDPGATVDAEGAHINLDPRTRRPSLSASQGYDIRDAIIPVRDNDAFFVTVTDALVDNNVLTDPDFMRLATVKANGDPQKFANILAEEGRKRALAAGGKGVDDTSVVVMDLQKTASTNSLSAILPPNLVIPAALVGGTTVLVGGAWLVSSANNSSNAVVTPSSQSNPTAGQPTITPGQPTRAPATNTPVPPAKPTPQIVTGVGFTPGERKAIDELNNNGDAPSIPVVPAKPTTVVAFTRAEQEAINAQNANNGNAPSIPTVPVPPQRTQIDICTIEPYTPGCGFPSTYGGNVGVGAAPAPQTPGVPLDPCITDPYGPTCVKPLAPANPGTGNVGTTSGSSPLTSNRDNEGRPATTAPEKLSEFIVPTQETDTLLNPNYREDCDTNLGYYVQIELWQIGNKKYTKPGVMTSKWCLGEQIDPDKVPIRIDQAVYPICDKNTGAELWMEKWISVKSGPYEKFGAPTGKRCTLGDNGQLATVTQVAVAPPAPNPAPNPVPVVPKPASVPAPKPASKPAAGSPTQAAPVQAAPVTKNPNLPVTGPNYTCKVNSEVIANCPDGYTCKQSNYPAISTCQSNKQSMRSTPNLISSILDIFVKGVLAQENSEQGQEIEADAFSINRPMSQKDFAVSLAANQAKQDLLAGLTLNVDSIKEDILSNLFIQPLGVKTEEGIKVTTGSDGSVSFDGEENNYKITEVSKVPGTNISYPEKIEIKKGINMVYLAIHDGDGKVEKQSGDNLVEHLHKGAAFTIVKIAAFYDKNNNNRLDKGEDMVPWAGISVSIIKDFPDQTINLEEGWNLITLPGLPNKPLTASAFIKDVALQQGYVTTISALDNGVWKTYVKRADTDYSGEDFLIEPSKAYFVKVIKPISYQFAGSKFVSPIKAKLTSGWNAVGVVNTEYTRASKLIDGINSKNAMADVVSRWQESLWDSMVLKKEKYGIDFAIARGRGYLIRLKNPGEYEL